MKSFLVILVLVFTLSCSKDDNSNMTLKEIGLELNVNYKVQQQVIPSNNPSDWKFEDMPDTVMVKFVSDNEAIETHGSNAGVTRNFILHTRAVQGKEFGLDFVGSSTPCTAKTCPIVIAASGGCTLLATTSGVILQKPSSTNFLDGYKFVKQ